MAEMTDKELMELIQQQETASTEAEIRARIGVLSGRLATAQADGDAFQVKNLTMRLDLLRTRVGSATPQGEAHTTPEIDGLRAENARLSARVAELEDDLARLVAPHAGANLLDSPEEPKNEPEPDIEATDAAKKLALESGIPLADVPHDGLKINKDDVTRYLDKLTGGGA